MRDDFISVIIPSGRPDRVADTLRSLANQTVPQEKYEIVVVTPESGVLPQVYARNILVISTDCLYPPGRMRNIGAKNAHGKYLLFIDDDCKAPEGLLQHMTHVLNTKKEVGAVGCRVVASAGTFWNRCADQALFTAYQLKKTGSVSALGSAALAVRWDVFTEVGGFDEELKASEDWDFSLKIQKQGWQCWFSQELEVLHDHRRGSLLDILRSAWQYGRDSGLKVQQRHQEAVTWVARMMVAAANKKIYWVPMLPYSLFLTLVWLLETRPVRMLPCLPVLFLARLSYQCGVYKSLQEES